MYTRETTNVYQGHITDVGYHKEHERVAHGYIMKITNVKVENDIEHSEDISKEYSMSIIAPQKNHEKLTPSTKGIYKKGRYSLWTLKIE